MSKNYKTTMELPNAKKDLKKQFMIDYVISLNDAEELDWFSSVFEANAEQRTSNFDSSLDYEGYKMGEVRKAFIKRYCGDKYKKTREVEKKLSPIEILAKAKENLKESA
jgi:hypothetical protein